MIGSFEKRQVLSYVLNLADWSSTRATRALRIIRWCVENGGEFDVETAMDPMDEFGTFPPRQWRRAMMTFGPATGAQKPSRFALGPGMTNGSVSS